MSVNWKVDEIGADLLLCFYFSASKPPIGETGWHHLMSKAHQTNGAVSQSTTMEKNSRMKNIFLVKKNWSGLCGSLRWWINSFSRCWNFNLNLQELRPHIHTHPHEHAHAPIHTHTHTRIHTHTHEHAHAHTRHQASIKKHFYWKRKPSVPILEPTFKILKANVSFWSLWISLGACLAIV